MVNIQNVVPMEKKFHFQFYHYLYSKSIQANSNLSIIFAID